MQEVITFLKENNTEFDIGIINNNVFHKLPTPFEDKQVIRFKWKSNALKKLVNKLSNRGVILKVKANDKYSILYEIDGTKNQLFIIFAVDSHVQLPKVLLKNFRTDENLYFLKTDTNEILKSSAKNYNTKFGYYSLQFEDYLSNNYENIITEILNKITLFVNEKEQSISFEKWDTKINKLFFMSIFRSPKQIEDINNKSVFSKLFKDGYSPEYIAYVGEQMKENFIKGYKPIPLVNKTNFGIVTFKLLVSNMFIDGGIGAMVMPIHPNFAIALIPQKYYDKMKKDQGNQTYLLMKDDNEVLKLNKQIYNNAKYNNEDIIGFKEDLENLKNKINSH